jgi:hypothetical protein
MERIPLQYQFRQRLYYWLELLTIPKFYSLP